MRNSLLFQLVGHVSVPYSEAFGWHSWRHQGYLVQELWVGEMQIEIQKATVETTWNKYMYTVDCVHKTVK